MNASLMTWFPISRCRACHAADDGFTRVLEMEPMPLAGMFCPSPDDARSAPRFPLTWVQCQYCGLVQVLEDVADEDLFTRYNYASSTVGGLVRHFQAYADVLVARYGDSGVRFLEIGCNDGVLLRQLPVSWRLQGCDPSDVARLAASRTSHYELIARPFSVDTVEDSQLENSVDVISGSNCLAHISDLRGVFAGVRRALRPGGHFWVEVHDLAALLHGAQWDTIYHEHKAEWSEEALIRCLAPLGLAHVHTWRTPMHGGALRVLFEKRDGASTPSGMPDLSSGLATLRRAYEARYDHPAARTLQRLQHAGRAFAAYGAAGRANVYLNQLPDLHFAYIVDESPLRAGKYLPAVATPVVTPATLAVRQVDACLITAWNYRADIVAKHPEFGGAWLTAFDDLDA